MYLDNISIINYRSCKQLELSLYKDDPNIFIGINDCGKTTILKAIGLLLDDKPIFYSVKDNSSKRDFSNSPLSAEEFEAIFANKNLHTIPYTTNQTVVLGKFILEENDIDESDLSVYSNLLLWSIEKSADNAIWIAFVKEATDEKLILTYQEIQNLKDAIPDNIAGSKEQKFYKMLEKFVKEKLNEKLEEKISWSVLPTKGNELAQLLLNYIDSIDKISPKIKTAFDKLTTKDVICQPNIIEIKE